MTVPSLLARLRESCIANDLALTRDLLRQISAIGGDFSPSAIGRTLHRLARELSDIPPNPPLPLTLSSDHQTRVGPLLAVAREVFTTAQANFEADGDILAAALCRKDRGLAALYSHPLFWDDGSPSSWAQGVKDLEAARRMLKESEFPEALADTTATLAFAHLNLGGPFYVEAAAEYATCSLLGQAVSAYFSAALRFAQEKRFIDAVHSLNLALSIVPMLESSSGISYYAELGLAVLYRHLKMMPLVLEHLERADDHFFRVTGEIGSAACSWERARGMIFAKSSSAELFYEVSRAWRAPQISMGAFADSLDQIINIDLHTTDRDLPTRASSLFVMGRHHECLWGEESPGSLAVHAFSQLGLWTHAIEEACGLRWASTFVRVRGRADPLGETTRVAEASRFEISKWLPLVPEARRAQEMLARFRNATVAAVEGDIGYRGSKGEAPPPCSTHDPRPGLRLRDRLLARNTAAEAVVAAGRILLGLGEPELALAAVDQLSVSTSVDVWSGLAAAMLAGESHACQRRWDESVICFQRAGNIARDLGPDGCTAAARALLASKAANLAGGFTIGAARDAASAAHFLISAGEHWTARDCFDEAAALFAAADNLEGRAHALMGAGEASLRAGRPREAGWYVGTARDLLESLHDDTSSALVEADLLLARAMVAVGRYDDAYRCGHAARVATDGDEGWVEENAIAHLVLAECCLRQDHLFEAHRHLDAARAPSGLGDDPSLAARHALLVAETEYLRGKGELAFDMASEALASEALDDLSRGFAHALLARLHLAFASGDRPAAHARLATDHASDALATFDAQRYKIGDPVERRRWWAEFCEPLIEELAGFAESAGQHALLAQLLEACRLQALPAGSLWVDQSPPVRGDSRGNSSFRGHVVVTVGEPARKTLSSYETVRLEDAIEVTAGTDAVYWGMWREGRQMLWSVVSTDGVIAAGSLDPTVLEECVIRLRRVIRPSDATQRGLSGDELVDVAGSLGPLLLPSALRDLLTSTTTPTAPLIIAPSPALADIPFSLLRVDNGDDRIAERRVVRLAVTAATTRQTLLRNQTLITQPRRNPAVLAVIDPGGERVLTRLSRAEWARTVLTRADHLVGVPASEGQDVQEATASNLALALQGHPDILLWYGHCQRSLETDPLSHGLVMVDGALTARHWYYEPWRWPAPSRVALIACASAGLTDRESLGLGTAAIAAGAQHVAATAWPIPAHSDAVPFIETVARMLSGTDDPVLAWNEHVVTELLPKHRSGASVLDPRLWASLQWLSVSAPAPDRGDNFQHRH